MHHSTKFHWKNINDSHCNHQNTDKLENTWFWKCHTIFDYFSFDIRYFTNWFNRHSWVASVMLLYAATARRRCTRKNSLAVWGEFRLPYRRYRRLCHRAAGTIAVTRVQFCWSARVYKWSYRTLTRPAPADLTPDTTPDVTPDMTSSSRQRYQPLLAISVMNIISDGRIQVCLFPSLDMLNECFWGINAFIT